MIMPSASYDENATKAARRILEELSRKLGVSAELPPPVVHTYSLSPVREMLRFALDFMLWPLRFGAPSPWVGSCSARGVIICPRGDSVTLEHEVRHHFCHQLRLRAYSDPVIRSMLTDIYGFADSSPEALARRIGEVSPWVSEGFASEHTLLDLFRAPLKLLLTVAAVTLIGMLVLLLPSLPLHWAVPVLYLAGGIASQSYRFLRTLPLDVGVLRWRWLRRRVEDAMVTRLLLFPPVRGTDIQEILRRPGNITL